jgi:molybdenum cofactor guanylyltransferase
VPALGAIILAGGRAARLGGADKPGLVVGGRSLLASVTAAAAEAGAVQIVVVGPHRPGLIGAPRFVREEPPGSGPVPALRRGLAELDADWAAVLAADLPFLRAGHVRALLGAAAGPGGAVLVDDEDCPQWLTGCWRAAPLRRAAAGYEGASLRGLMAPLNPARVVIRGGPQAWLDCDTEDDLRLARAAAQGVPPGTTTLRSGSPATNRRIWSAVNCAASG